MSKLYDMIFKEQPRVSAGSPEGGQFAPASGIGGGKFVGMTSEQIAGGVKSGSVDLKGVTWEERTPRMMGFSQYKTHQDGVAFTLNVSSDTVYPKLGGTRLRDTNKTFHIVTVDIIVGRDPPLSLFSKKIKGEGQVMDAKKYANLRAARKFVLDKFGIDARDTLWTPD